MEGILKSTMWLPLIIAIFSFFIGLKFPDIDLKLGWKHRNILTHTPLFLLTMLFFHFVNPSIYSQNLILGFAQGTAIHYIFDLFPKKWAWGALIHLPLIKFAYPPNISKRILWFSAVISGIVSIYFTKSFFEYIILSIIGILTIIKNMKKEKKLYRPLIFYVFLVILVGFFRYKEVEGFLYLINEKVKNLIYTI